MGIIDQYLKKYRMTRYQVAKLTGVNTATLQSANEKKIDSMSIKVLKAVAMATGKTAGQALDEMLLLEGNSIINFIEAHPDADQTLVKEVKNQMTSLYEHGFDLTTVTFNRYYDEGEDTTERANQLLEDLKTTFVEIMEVLSKKLAGKWWAKRL